MGCLQRIKKINNNNTYSIRRTQYYVYVTRRHVEYVYYIYHTLGVQRAKFACGQDGWAGGHVPDEFVYVPGYLDQIVAAHVQVLESGDGQQLLGEVRQPVAADVEHLEVGGVAQLLREPVVVDQIVLGHQRAERQLGHEVGHVGQPVVADVEHAEVLEPVDGRRQGEHRVVVEQHRVDAVGPVARAHVLQVLLDGVAVQQQVVQVHRLDGRAIVHRRVAVAALGRRAVVPVEHGVRIGETTTVTRAVYAVCTTIGLRL